MEIMLKFLSFFVRQIPTNRIPLKNIKWYFVSNSLKLFGSIQPRFIFNLKFSGLKWSSEGYPDVLTRHLLFEGYYQLDVLTAISQYLKPGNTFIDIGGHHGLMALTGAKAVGASGKVISFEPNPQAVKIIELHKKINAIENVKIVPLGLSNVEGETTFYIQKGNVSWNSTIIPDFVDDCFHEGFEKQLINITTLDKFVKTENISPTLIKIDVEGAEFLILEGAIETLRKFRPALLMEFNPVSVKAANSSISTYVEFLKNLNYKLIVLKKTFWGYYDSSRFEEFDENVHTRKNKLSNVFCVPQ
jgi:FkbM family methyltransferase